MNWLLIFVFLIPYTSPNYKRTGKATTFYPIERHNNGKFACSLEDWHDWQKDAPVCAHRTLPCGAWIKVTNLKTKKSTWCKIMDRGPYGKRDKNGVRFNSATDRKKAKKTGRAPKKGRYISILDKSRGVTRQIGATGMTRVKVEWWKDNPRSKELDRDLCERWKICKDYR